MKAVVQRVTRASVTVGGEQISAIGRGICVLLGISVEDSQKELEHMHLVTVMKKVTGNGCDLRYCWWLRGITQQKTELVLEVGVRNRDTHVTNWSLDGILLAFSIKGVRKILNLRVFEDESGKHWSKSVMDKQYEVLCVSQFTLQCVLKGNKPDFHLAMPTEQAESFYNSFLEQLRKNYRPELIRDGKFGACMQVLIQNDGPVTIELESPAPGAASSDPKQLSKLEKQQQRKEKTRAKGPSESSKERNAPRKEDRSASSGAEGDVSWSGSHSCRSRSSANYLWAEPDPGTFKMLSPYTALRIRDSNMKRKSELRHWEPESPAEKHQRTIPFCVLLWSGGVEERSWAHTHAFPTDRGPSVFLLSAMASLAFGAGGPSIICLQVCCGVFCVSTISFQHVPAVHVVSITESQDRAGVRQPTTSCCMRLCIL